MKKKINLTELRVTSFLTTLSEEQAALMGGTNYGGSFSNKTKPCCTPVESLPEDC
ncbi:MAG: pinensin family lanthipeptide [Acidobacteriota bacterium]|nr:pinensin family lanthipeptide [Acidobacteriota bacterium]